MNNPVYKEFDPSLVQLLREGGIAFIPTDTMYGISCSAQNQDAVERVYVLRKRNPVKPYIILISSSDDLARFGISLSEDMKKDLEALWPNPISILFPCTTDAFAYLHRGTCQLAFRMPDNSALRDFVAQTGPLISTSANQEGMPPSATLEEAYAYFGDDVDAYVDRGPLQIVPSTLIAYVDTKTLRILREGAVSSNALCGLIPWRTVSESENP